MNKLISKIKLNNVIICIIGSFVLAFGLYNVHSISNITEGGILGMTLLLDHWFDISPAITSAVMNVICYIIGIKTLGAMFIIYSGVSGIGFSLFYAIFEQFEPIYPKIAEMPLFASIIGAIFVGVGCGLCVRAGGAPSGDDALAMSISKISGKDIRYAYLITDLSVLLLSLSYIEMKNIVYSLFTVIISGQIIGVIQNLNFKKRA